MMNKRLLIVLLVVVLFTNLALAEFNPQKGVNFLVSKINSDGSVEGDVVKTGFAALLFNKIGGRNEAEKAADFLKSKEDSSGCFPSSSCKVKDTAIAIIALANLNRDITKSLDFLKKAQSTGLGTSQLLLQVATSGKGNCTASFDINGQSFKKSFLIDEGRFSSCGNVNFLDLNSNCIKGGLASSFPGTEVQIDCSDVSSSTVIGTIFKKNNDVFLGESFNSKIAKIIVESGCYGVNSKTTCNLDSSLFAGWSLVEADADFNIIPFLKQNIDQNSPLHLSLIALTTNEERFLNELKKKQNSNGGFDNSVTTTAFAILALSQKEDVEIKKARDFLKSKQNTDGSWNQNPLDTALGLLALSSEVVIDLPSGVPQPTTCDRDGFCDETLGEDEDTCPSDCVDISDRTPREQPIEQTPCDENGFCDRESGEDEINCPVDCAKEITDTIVPKEPTTEENSSSGNILLFIVLIIIVLGIIFFVYKKLKKGKGNKLEPKTPFRPFSVQLNQKTQKNDFGSKLFKPLPQKRTVVETELEKSIEEAKRLLKK